MKEVKADYTTWCSKDMLAGVILANILNELGSVELINTVNTVLGRLDRRLKALSMLDDKVNVSKEYFANLMIVDMKKNVLSYNLPIEVETHLLNVMTAKYRRMLNIGKP